MSYVTNKIRMDYFSCLGKRTRAKTDLYIERLYRLSKLKKNEDSKGHNNERKLSKNVVKAERGNASSVSARNKGDGKKSMIGGGFESSESRVSDDVEYLGVGLKFKGNDGIIRDDDVGSCVSAAGFGSSGVNLRCCKSKDEFGGGGGDVIEVIQKEDGIEVIQQEDVIEVIQIEDGIEVIQQEDVIEVIQKEDGIEVIQQEDVIGVIQKEDVIEVIPIEDGIEVIQEVIQIEEESD